jgi:hypothetical protein
MSEAAWLQLPWPDRRDQALKALTAFSGNRAAAAISLGVTPQTFLRHGREHGLFSCRQPVPANCYEDGESKAADRAQARANRARLKDADLTALTAEIDRYASIAHYCQATGQSYQKILRLAHKAKYPGIRPYIGPKARAAKVREQLPAANNQTALWWARNVLSIDVETITEHDLQQARKALRLAGLIPVCLKVGHVVWRHHDLLQAN